MLLSEGFGARKRRHGIGVGGEECATDSSEVGDIHGTHKMQSSATTGMSLGTEAMVAAIRANPSRGR